MPAPYIIEAKSQAFFSLYARKSGFFRIIGARAIFYHLLDPGS
jgi:hypothetical protein